MIKKGFLVVFCATILAFSSSSCSSSNKEKTLTFAQNEYTIQTGETITIKEDYKGVKYHFGGNSIPAGLSLNSDTGLITFDETIDNYTQVLYYATLDDIQSDFVVITLSKKYEQSVLQFVNPIDYISDGDYILATNSNGFSISYELVDEPRGISIDSVTGRISFTSGATNGETFTVRVSSHGVETSKTFIVATEQLAKVTNDTQSVELNGEIPVAYFLDFSDITSEEYSNDFIGVMYNKQLASSDSFIYDSDTQRVTLLPNYLSTFNAGENEIILITSRNTISVKLLVATKFIKTAEDLASIGENRDSLKGYYILLNDIDLTSYLSVGGKGYNDNKGWNPIGVYHDVTDGTALLDTFQGTFDGNGYTISGLYISRSDELSYNSGLFGYVSNLGVIKNLGVTSRAGTVNNVRSYSGGLAGFNAGTIMNCWSDVDLTNYSGENIFKIIGGLVGRNEGTIENCFAYGTVTGDDAVGSLVGYNSGVINYCYATKEGAELLIGQGGAATNSIQFDTLADLFNYDYSNYFDSLYWSFDQSSQPTLNHYLEYYFLFDIQIANSTATITRGQTLTIEVTINPSNLQSQYIDEVKYFVEGEGYTIDGNKIYTANAIEYEFIVSISLEVSGVVYSDSATFKLFDAVSTVVISSSTETVMEAGSSYKLECQVEPLTANQDVTWKLFPSTIYGVSIEQDVLTIDEDVQVSQFGIYASASGKSSTIQMIQIKKFEYLPQIYTYNDTTLPDTISFELPNNLDLGNVEVYRYNKKVEFSIQDNCVVVDSELIRQIPNTTLTFTFRLSDGNAYRTYATYLSHSNYDLNYVVKNYESYITLSSKEDFYKYFNMKDYNENRFVNYSKTFVLTNDIDFGGDIVYSIGYSDKVFNGTIFGQGYSIKNLTINENEQYFVLSSQEQENNYRSSKYAVGFFGSFNGSIYDVVFENVTVKANNWVGTFACTIDTNAVLENVVFINCKSMNANELTYPSSSEDKVAKVAPTCSGRLIGVIYDYKNTNLVG